MKRKVIIGLCILAAFILLFPHSAMYYDDGGSVRYEAPLYSVTKVHAFHKNAKGVTTIVTGTVVEILGFEVFDNVPWDA